MSVIDVFFEYKWVILFYSVVIGVAYLNRSRFEKNAGFIFLLKTKIGIQAMDIISKRFRFILKILGYLSILVAYLGMGFISYILIQNTYEILIQKPGVIGGSPVIPGLPIAGTEIVIPLIIGWLSLVIITTVHEFSHGVIARVHNVKIKSSGLALFGPIMGAFVEPDEKQLRKKPNRVQHSIFAAGPVSNIILYFLCSLAISHMLIPLMSLTAAPVGIQIDVIKNESLPAFQAGIVDGAIITGIDDNTIVDDIDFFAALEDIKPYQNIEIRTRSGATYQIVTIENPLNASKGYIGITNFQVYFAEKNPVLLNKIALDIIRWLIELLVWTALLSLSIGLFNLFPIFLTDGAQMLRNNFQFIFSKNQKLGNKLWFYINVLGLVILFVMLSQFFLDLIKGVLMIVFSIVLSLFSIVK